MSQDISLQHSIVSHCGLKRKDNQDAFAISQSPFSSLYLIADGMGGAKGGAFASSFAANYLARNAFDENLPLSTASIEQAIAAVNAALYKRASAQRELIGMGTTVACVGVVNNKAIVVNVGDTRIYLLRNQKLSRLSSDHTIVQELVDNGDISLAEAEHHPIGHMLTRSLGPKDKVLIEVRELESELLVGDKFFLCSDGLYNLVQDKEIETVLVDCELQQATEILLDMAMQRGGTDNVTIVVFEVVEAKKQKKEQTKNVSLVWVVSTDLAEDDLVAKKKGIEEVAEEEKNIEAEVLTENEKKAEQKEVVEEFKPEAVETTAFEIFQPDVVETNVNWIFGRQKEKAEIEQEAVNVLLEEYTEPKLVKEETKESKEENENVFQTIPVSIDLPLKGEMPELAPTVVPIEQKDTVADDNLSKADFNQAFAEEDLKLPLWMDWALVGMLFLSGVLLALVAFFAFKKFL